jgi:hypothetical protein
MSITERVDSMVVRASAPDGRVSAELHGRTGVRVDLAPGYFYRADEADLESSLTQLAKLMFAGRMREYYAIISDEIRQTVVPDERAISALDTRFYEERDNLVAEGRGAGGRILLQVRGMKTWIVHIARGTLRELTEDEFTSGVADAAAELILDQQAKVRELKVRTYAPEFIDDYPDGQA